MNFLTKSLITITILVVAIWVMPATSNEPVIGQLKEICETMLKKGGCNFENDQPDFEGTVESKFKKITAPEKIGIDEENAFCADLGGSESLTEEEKYKILKNEILKIEEEKKNDILKNKILKNEILKILTEEEKSLTEEQIDEILKTLTEEEKYEILKNDTLKTLTEEEKYEILKNDILKNYMILILKNHALRFMIFLSAVLTQKDVKMPPIKYFCDQEVTEESVEQFKKYLSSPKYSEDKLNKSDLLNTEIKDLKCNLADLGL